MNDEYREALVDMVEQFAYRFDGRSAQKPNSLGTAGLSALEHAFSVLGMSDPEYRPDQSCDIIKCWKWPQAGIPLPNGDYWSVCSDHSAFMRQGPDHWQYLVKKRGRGYGKREQAARLKRFGRV